MRKAAAVLPLAMLLAACDSGETSRVPPPVPPPVARIASSLDTTRLNRAYARADSLVRLRSMLVQWKGELIGEKYFHGATASRRANIKSASKSIISALVGMAIQQGHIEGVHATIGELLPAETRGLDSLKRSITVEDLLTMRAGLQSTSFGGYGRWVSSRNWVRDALARPMVDVPGGQMIYSTGSTHLLSAILTQATGMSTYRFARRNLADPLDIPLRPWLADPQGIYFGGNEMYLTPRAMLKFGTLYLNRGAWRGRQVVPAAWVDSSWVPRTFSRFNGNQYGYGWWSRRSHGVDVRFAWGYGGQFIFVVPALDLVVVTTSDSDSPRERGHNSEIHRLVDQEIIPAVSTID